MACLPVQRRRSADRLGSRGCAGRCRLARRVDVRRARQRARVGRAPVGRSASQRVAAAGLTPHRPALRSRRVLARTAGRGARARARPGPRWAGRAADACPRRDLDRGVLRLGAPGTGRAARRAARGDQPDARRGAGQVDRGQVDGAARRDDGRRRARDEQPADRDQREKPAACRSAPRRPRPGGRGGDLLGRPRTQRPDHEPPPARRSPRAGARPGECARPALEGGRRGQVQDFGRRSGARHRRTRPAGDLRRRRSDHQGGRRTRRQRDRIAPSDRGRDLGRGRRRGAARLRLGRRVRDVAAGAAPRVRPVLQREVGRSAERAWARASPEAGRASRRPDHARLRARERHGREDPAAPGGAAPKKRSRTGWSARRRRPESPMYGRRHRRRARPHATQPTTAEQAKHTGRGPRRGQRDRSADCWAGRRGARHGSPRHSKRPGSCPSGSSARRT